MMESGEWWENDHLLMEYEDMLNDPIWEKWEKQNACSD
ncbi:hypothetical protein D1BOALGB6SA_10639 [Olavius sp. associated proteobacterium Delta 1]|nr:hypothetical protein D1BOALGB6SA_10639 [Olavius sp. associated proteobacterium Delta 1]